MSVLTQGDIEFVRVGPSPPLIGWPHWLHSWNAKYGKVVENTGSGDGGFFSAGFITWLALRHLGPHRADSGAI